MCDSASVVRMSNARGEAATATVARPLDAMAIVSFGLSLAASSTLWIWGLPALLAIAALAGSLVSRKALRRDPSLRGTALSLAAFLIAIGVLVVTLGPSLLSSFLFMLAPPAP